MVANGEQWIRASAACGWIVLAIAAAVVWGAIAAIDPALESSGPVPAGEFSAERAGRDVEALARAPRPLGTAAHAAVRELLARRLSELGLTVEIQEETVVRPLGAGSLLAARVRNVVGRKAGSGAGRLSLVSHYDSEAQTFGAGDAASGVATILETLRALGPAWRPVPALEVAFTDGEELGLMGARALAARRPAVDGGDVLLNFEARGQKGPVAMFETSPGNLSLLRRFARAAPRPFASSLSYEVYRRMPNDTDFTVFREAGVDGLNFAFIAGHSAYHSRLDTAEALARGTLEQEGVNALALVRAMGAGDLAGRAAIDAIYFNPWGTHFLVYPVTWAWPLCLAILIAVGAVLVVLGLRFRVRWSRVLLTAVLWIVGLAVASVVGWSFDRVLRVDPSLLRSAYGEPYDFRPFVAVLALTVGSALLALWALRGRALAAAEVLGGSLLFWSLALVLLTAAVPGASYLAAWPIGFLGLGTVLVSLRSPIGAPAVVVMGLVACPGIAVWAPVADLVFQALGLGAAFLLAPLLALAWSLLALPVRALVGGPRWLPALALLAVATVWGGSLVLGDEVSSRRPGVDTLAWLQDAEGEAHWFSFDRAPDRWTTTFLDRSRVLLPEAVAQDLEVAAGASEELGLQPPLIEVDSDEVENGRRRIAMHFLSPRGAPVLRAALDSSAGVTRLRVGGVTVSPEEVPDGPFRVIFYGFEPFEASVELELEAGEPLTVELVDQSWGLPERLLRAARPDALIPAPGWLTDSTFVAARREL